MNKKITYKVYSKASSILSQLDSFPNSIHSSPYQRFEYIKMAIGLSFFYSLIRRSKPFFVVFSINGKNIMLMPLSKSFFSEKYFMFGDRAGFGYLDVIWRSELSISDMKACINLLLKKFPNAVFYLNRIRKESMVYRALKGSSSHESAEICVSIELPCDYDSYFKSLSKSSKQNFRTAENRINKSSSSLSFSRLSKVDMHSSLRSKIIKVYIERLRFYKKHVNFLDKIFYKYFDLGFLSISDIDFSEVCILFINDEIAAFMVCLSHDDEILVPRLAINSSYVQYSPGVLLIHYAIRDFLEDGSSISKLDLMQGEEKYKFQLGGKESKLYSFSLSNEKIL